MQLVHSLAEFGNLSNGEILEQITDNYLEMTIDIRKIVNHDYIF